MAVHALRPISRFSRGTRLAQCGRAPQSVCRRPRVCVLAQPTRVRRSAPRDRRRNARAHRSWDCPHRDEHRDGLLPDQHRRQRPARFCNVIAPRRRQPRAEPHHRLPHAPGRSVAHRLRRYPVRDSRQSPAFPARRGSLGASRSEPRADVLAALAQGHTLAQAPAQPVAQMQAIQAVKAAF